MNMISSIWTSAFVAAVLVLPAGCSGGASGAEAAASDLPTSESQNRYGGEELLKGIFFGAGEVGKKFPEVWANARSAGSEEALDTEASETSAQYRRPSSDDVSRVVARIGTSNPGFFDRFASDVQSGDPIRIRDALRGATATLQGAAQGSADGMLSAAAGMGSGDCIIILVPPPIVILAAGKRPTAQGVPNSDALSDDQLVGMIAERLAN